MLNPFNVQPPPKVVYKRICKDCKIEIEFIKYRPRCTSCYIKYRNGGVEIFRMPPP